MTKSKKIPIPGQISGSVGHALFVSLRTRFIICFSEIPTRAL